MFGRREVGYGHRRSIWIFCSNCRPLGQENSSKISLLEQNFSLGQNLRSTREETKKGSNTAPMPASTSPQNIRDLTKPRRRRQRHKAIGLVSKTTTLHEHRAFLYISSPSLHNHDMKWTNFKFFQDWNGKAINSTISVWTRAQPPSLLPSFKSH